MPDTSYCMCEEGCLLSSRVITSPFDYYAYLTQVPIINLLIPYNRICIIPLGCMEYYYNGSLLMELWDIFAIATNLYEDVQRMRSNRIFINHFFSSEAERLPCDTAIQNLPLHHFGMQVLVLHQDFISLVPSKTTKDTSPLALEVQWE